MAPPNSKLRGVGLQFPSTTLYFPERMEDSPSDVIVVNMSGVISNSTSCSSSGSNVILWNVLSEYNGLSIPARSWLSTLQAGGLTKRL